MTYLLHQAFWHQGFAGEAAAVTHDFAFSVLGKLWVISQIGPVNIPSPRVAIRVKMLFEKMTVYTELDHLIFGVTKLS